MRAWSALVVVLLSGCPGPAPSVVADGGMTDAGRTDAGRMDAGGLDAGGPDAGGGDSGVIADGGSGADAGIVITRSLAWTDPTLLEDATTISLRLLLGTMCPGTPAGVVLEHWLESFSTTAHSERAGPALLRDQLIVQHGSDPSTWPLEDVPLEVTGIHNRVDLARDGHCGEFRVSMASVDPVYRPLHFIWLFRQPGPDCTAAARRWAALSSADQATFMQGAQALVAEHVTAERFLLAESVEFTVSPWEWRQWRFEPVTPVGNRTCAAVNPPLFQQVDQQAVDDAAVEFGAWVDANAAALDARTLQVPDRFRRPSIRVNQGVPWVPLRLSGVSPATTAAFPQLRRNIEIVGCAACHVADAPFVQTQEDRTFSPFYRKELDARAELLARMAAGEAPVIPFGPLQSAPVLPP